MTANYLKIKVCGMRQPDNITEVAALQPDYMGFIFYEQSPRYAGALDPCALPSTIRRVGVFVNAPLPEIIAIAKHYGLRTLQLHGSEPPELCETLRIKGYEVIKAFGIAAADDFAQTVPYEENCDLFLFDTRTPDYGGSGRRFNWTILNLYNGNTPFFLSGGISAADADELLKINHSKLYGIDLNSRFETEAGIKDAGSLERFIKTIRS